MGSAARERPGSLSEFYRTSGYAAFPQEHHTAGSLPVSFLRAEQQAHDLVDPAVPEVVLCTSLASEMDYRWNLGDGWRGRRLVTGDMNLAPVDTEIAFECSGDHEILAMTLPVRALEAMLDRETGQRLSALEPLTGRTLFRDAELRETMLRMWHESVRHDAAASLMVDGLTRSLVARLLRLAGRGGPAGPVRTGRLDAVSLARVEAYVDAHLGEALTLDALASLVPLSASQFTRAFRETTGRTPWAWVLERRVRRAAELLRTGGTHDPDGTASITAIALNCGFSSQSHLTQMFRTRYGTTPARYRRDAGR